MLIVVCVVSYYVLLAFLDVYYNTPSCILICIFYRHHSDIHSYMLRMYHAVVLVG